MSLFHFHFSQTFSSISKYSEDLILLAKEQTVVAAAQINNKLVCLAKKKLGRHNLA
jgi:hypothetical protein